MDHALLRSRDAMPSLGAMLLATMLLAGPPPARPGPLEVRRGAFDLELELTLDWHALQRALIAQLPLGDRLQHHDGWIGVSLTEDLALLVDVRVQGVPSSPDPARPASRGAFTASLGISVSAWDG